MSVTAATIAPFVPLIQLLGKIIAYLTELQKSSKKHSAALAEIKTGLAQLKKMLEDEIEDRKKEQERSASERSLNRKLAVGALALTSTSWLYIGLHLARLLR